MSDGPTIPVLEELKALREKVDAMPVITFGTEDLTAGVSPLPYGHIHIVYEEPA